MKIDHDYLKKFLEECQSSEGPTFDIEDLAAAGLDYTNPEFEFHIAILYDQGFIQKVDGDPGFGIVKSIGGYSAWSVVPLRLTASGQDFVDSMQNVEVWAKTKAAVKTVGGVGFEVFVQIAKAEARRLASEKLGLSI